MRYVLALLVALALGSAILWFALDQQKTDQNFKAGHAALCSYFDLASQSTRLSLEQPPPGDTPQKRAIRFKILEFEQQFLRTC